MTERIPYYRVLGKKDHAYWCPNKRMRSLGFEMQALGIAGPAAQAAARELNARWQTARKESPARLGVRAPSLQAPEADVHYVYFLIAGDRIKIGVSRTPMSRVADVALGAADRVREVLVVPGTRADEKKLHRRFASYRTRGEWFVANRALQLTIMRCAAAGAVVHDGPESGTNNGLGVESREGVPLESHAV